MATTDQSTRCWTLALIVSGWLCAKTDGLWSVWSGVEAGRGMERQSEHASSALTPEGPALSLSFSVRPVGV